MKYLGNYFDDKDNNLNNYLDRIPFSNYYEELIERNILKVQNYFSNWIEKETIEMEAKKMCFFLESEKDLIVFGNKFISVFDINPFKIKKNIEFNEDIQIIDIIKLTSNRICFYSRDGYIKIITFSENKKKCESLIELILSNKYATKLIYLNNDDFLCIDDKNIFRFYKLELQERFRNIKSISEKDKILIMKELSNDRIIYIIEDKDKKKLIKFIDIKNRKKEEYFVEVPEEKNPLKVIDIIILNNYILICYDYRIDFINYNEKDIMIKSSKYFVHEITNIIKLSYDKIILGLYDKEKNESLIREHILRKEDLNKNIDKFDCIGQGKVESNRIENLLKINESQILIKTSDNFMIYERKNEVSDLLKKHLMAINKKVTIIKRKDPNPPINNGFNSLNYLDRIYQLYSAEGPNTERNQQNSNKINEKAENNKYSVQNKNQKYFNNNIGNIPLNINKINYDFISNFSNQEKKDLNTNRTNPVNNLSKNNNEIINENNKPENILNFFSKSDLPYPYNGPLKDYIEQKQIINPA